MLLRLVACALVLLSFAACDSLHSPYKKKDEEEKKPMRDQSTDQAFQSFMGRLRAAVSKHDTTMMASLMTADFGYRWDDAPPGETAFLYWDQHNLWGELSNVLQQRFGPHDLYMVAPVQAIKDSNYNGYRAGMRTVRGSWKFAYFVPAEGPR
jgi:hypothetical protein